MTNAKKQELIALLKGESEKKIRKTYSIRIESDVFDKVESISISSGVNNINDVLNALIELGLSELVKS